MNISRHTAKEKLRILDVGGGDGMDAIYYAKKGHTVTLNDCSSTMLAEYAGGPNFKIFQIVMGNINIIVTSDPIIDPSTGKEVEGNCITDGTTITCKTMPDLYNLIHEFGHVFDNRHNSESDDGLASDQLPDGGKAFARTYDGYACAPPAGDGGLLSSCCHLDSSR